MPLVPCSRNRAIVVYDRSILNRVISTMSNAATLSPQDLIVVGSFDDIRCDNNNPWNHVYCSTAYENFRAGESVEVEPPVVINGTTYASRVGAILRVDQHHNPPRVLLSLFLSITNDMGIRQHQPPDQQDYIQYPPTRVVWTRYQCWLPATCIRREAFVVTPWEVNNSLCNSHIAYGMANAYFVVAKWNNDVPFPHRRAFKPLGNSEMAIPGCLHSIDFECVTLRYWTFRWQVASRIVKVLGRSSKSGTITKVNVHVDGIHQKVWENFKNSTIPDESTDRKGFTTKRAIRKNLTVQLLKDQGSKQFARFGTAERFNLLKSFFGSGIQVVPRIRRFAGPKFSRTTGPIPAVKARRIMSTETVGAFIEFPDVQDAAYHTNEPGIDLEHNTATQQLTIRIHYG